MRRLKVAEHHAREDSSKWQPVMQALHTLDVAGMSGDETDADSESSVERGSIGGRKVVRRVEHPWLNPDVSQLMKSVDTYTGDEVMRYAGVDGLPVSQRGSPHLIRVWEATRHTEGRSAPRQLPLNWYHKQWWLVQSPALQEWLAPSKVKAIPTLVCYQCHPSTIYSLNHNHSRCMKGSFQTYAGS